MWPLRHGANIGRTEARAHGCTDECHACCMKHEASGIFGPMRRYLLAAILSAATVAPLAAQAPESNLYLPIASWATPYVEHLIRAGVLQGLDPLTRPLKRADVARAIAKVDTTDLAESVKSSLRLLAEELEERPDTVRWKVEANVAAQGGSDPSRWTVRPERENSGLFWQGGLTGSLEFPHVGIVTSPYFDTRLARDDAFVGKKKSTIAGDNAEAYVLASWKYLDVFFGIEPRNWGPPEVEGLILSDNPYPYDYFLIRLGPQRFRLELAATQLDNLPNVDSTNIRKRLLSLHRLVVVPSDRLAFSLSESALYADAGGPSRSFEPWFLNPVNLWALVNNNYVGSVNSLWAGDVSWRLRRGLTFASQIYLDDIQVNTGTAGTKPAEWGYTFSLTGGGAAGAISWSALYTRVDATDYRTLANEEQYTIRGQGLARNFADYDQTTARVTFATVPRAVFGGELTYIRQGEGDMRKPFPPASSWADSLNFLTGIIERTLRIAVQANWTPVYGINLSTDVGRHFIWNANHVQGVRGDRWVWRIRAEIRRRLAGGIHWGD